MGLLDDAGSGVSPRGSHRPHHRSSRSHRATTGTTSRREREYREWRDREREKEEHHRERRHHKERSRSKSRSPSRTRHRHRKSSSKAGSVVGSAVGGITGIAASIFGGGNDSDDEGLAYSDYKTVPARDSRYRGSGGYDDHHDEDGARSLFSGVGGGGFADQYGRRNSSSFFNMGNHSKSSFFAGFGGRSTTPASYYKRSPRPSFISRMLKKVRRLMRDLAYYAKKHPLKVFMLVIMPLISGGMLTALLAKVGIRLPRSLEKMMGMAVKAGTGDSVGLVRDAASMVRGTGGVSSVAGALVRSTSTYEKGRGGDGTQWEVARKVTKMFE